jgi:hypothetical protein
MKTFKCLFAIICSVFGGVFSFVAQGQFIDNFDGTGTPEGWVFFSGDGNATVDFRQKDGIASFFVDGTKDTLNIWWALTRRRITGIDMKKLARPEYELRVETRIRVSHAPRRVNLHFNHQRTTDFHSHLMEYYIPDTDNWHTISMTTKDFETRLGDSINCHLALMDWGLQKYRVDFDYFKVDVVNRNNVGPDLGIALPYHPPVADPSVYNHHAVVDHDAIIDSQFINKNLNAWHIRQEGTAPVNVLTVGGSQLIILRWDLEQYKGKKVERAALLELSPHSVQRSPDFSKDFGMVRVTEIIGGDPQWNEQTVTFESFRAGQPVENVINTQMIIDDSVKWDQRKKTLFTIPQPVMQRLIEGKTYGLAIKPLGAVTATFYSRNLSTERAPRLYFDVE